jgi:hypothetical protein
LKVDGAPGALPAGNRRIRIVRLSFYWGRRNLMTIRVANPARTQAAAARGYILAAWIKAAGRALEAAGRDSALSAWHRSAGEFTYLADFSFGRSFTRAFWRWTGQPPSHCRAGAVAP